MGEEGNNDAEVSIKPDVGDNGFNQSSSSTVSHQRRLASNQNHAVDPSRPSRNQQSSRSGQQPSQAKNFEFVLVTDNESRRQVRRHAMRQYMHQRRLDSIARLGTSRVPVSGWTNRHTSTSQASSSSARAEVLQDETLEDTRKPVLVKNEDQQIPAAKHEPHLPVISAPQIVKIEETPSLPLSSLFATAPQACPAERGSRDPFDSYPIQISDADHQLIQHFVVTYPSMMYKFVDSVPNNPMMEIFRQFALHDELPFQAMLAIASKHRAGVEGKKESVQSLTHKMRALRLMNERIQTDSKGQHDGTIYAVATMAVIEKWSKDASIERMHFRGLASMIRNRGGMQGMRISNPFLEKVLYWVDFSCAPKAIISTSLPWTGTVPDTPPAGFDFLDPELHLAIPHDPDTAEGSGSLCDQLRACEDFLRIFRRLHELENIALNSPPNLIPAGIHRRRRNFVPGTRLYSILTSLPDYDHGIRDIRFIDEYTEMACLFFLAIVLHDCYAKSFNFDLYLDWLNTEVIKLNPYTRPSITSILWLFLNNGGYPAGHPGDNGDRCWVVSRMVRIAKRLEWKRHGAIWDHLRKILIDFLLTQQECALSSNHVDEESLAARHQRRTQSTEYFWNEDEMREEILGIKISSHIDINVPVLT